MKDINKEATWKHLSDYKEGSEEWKFFKKAVKKGWYFVSNDGMSNMSNEFIMGMKEIKIKKYSPNEMAIQLLITICNYLNYIKLELNKEYSVDDPIVKKLGSFITECTKRAISNKDKVIFWKETDKLLKEFKQNN